MGLYRSVITRAEGRRSGDWGEGDWLMGGWRSGLGTEILGSRGG